jgi:hypothetical protein
LLERFDFLEVEYTKATMIKHKRLLLGFIGVLFACIAVAPLVHAASSERAPVTQSYCTDSVVQKGMIVRLNAKDSSKVEPLREDQSKDMLGVVVAANDAALSLTSDLSKRQVYVATYGKYEVLVSTQNGSISAGDLISISTIDGVGMKADGDTETVIGKALSSFDGASNVLGTSTLTDTSGKKTEVSLGRVRLQVLVQPNPLRSVALPTAFTNFLSRVGYSVSNKTVNPGRLYLALLVLVIASFVSAILMFSGVKSAMTAIGRNPLAKKAIYRSLVQVIISSLIVFIIGIFAVYLLLKL